MPPPLNPADLRFKRHANRHPHLAQRRRRQKPSRRGGQTKTSIVATASSDALAQLTQFSYDPLGNLLNLTDANGNTTHQHVYDAKSRLTSRIDPLVKVESYQSDGSDNTKDAPKYRGETHLQVGKDLLRLDPAGNFRSLYPVP